MQLITTTDLMRFMKKNNFLKNVDFVKKKKSFERMVGTHDQTSLSINFDCFNRVWSKLVCLKV